MIQTIMLIDDEIEILNMLKRYFSLEGYHVITADGGKVILDGQDILTGEENELAEIRQHKLGFVFQDLLRFYTPIYYLLQKYDMHPELETEAKEELISIVREFCETYKAKD